MKFACHFGNLLASRRGPSLVCLFAALLLQGPVVSALAIASGVCCAGDHCPIAAHHHSGAKSEEAPMDCDHNQADGGDKVRSCSMSCCETTGQFAVHANVFLLWPPIELASVNPFPETVSPFAASETVVPFAPLSPPPRSCQTSSEQLHFA
jgi:hypothetical protein